MVGVAGCHYWHWISLAVRRNDLITGHLVDIDVVSWVRVTQVAIHTFGVFSGSTTSGKKSAALIPVKSSLHVVPKWRACGWLIQFCLLSWQQTMNNEILTDNCLPSVSNWLLYKCAHTSHASCSKRCLPWSVCNLPVYELGKTGRAFIWRRQRVSDTYTINREIFIVKNFRSCKRLRKLNSFHSEFFCNK